MNKCVNEKVPSVQEMIARDLDNCLTLQEIIAIDHDLRNPDENGEETLQTIEQVRSEFCTPLFNVIAITRNNFGEMISQLDEVPERNDLGKKSLDSEQNVKNIDAFIEAYFGKFLMLAPVGRKVMADILLGLNSNQSEVNVGGTTHTGEVQDYFINFAADIDAKFASIFQMSKNYEFETMELLCKKAKMPKDDPQSLPTYLKCRSVSQIQIMNSLETWARIMRDELIVFWDKIEKNLVTLLSAQGNRENGSH